jgi:hypothetical protein
MLMEGFEDPYGFRFEFRELGIPNSGIEELHLEIEIPLCAN